MKNILYYFSLPLLMLFTSCNSNHKNNSDEKRVAYLCESPTAYSYHLDPECPGLKKCSHTVLQTTVLISKKQGRMFCGWEANDGIAR
jgi:hypothetical protein